MGAECSSVSCLRCTARGLFEPLLADMSPSCVHSSSPWLRQTEYAIGCNSLHMLRQFALARGAVGAGGAQPRMRSQVAADIGRRQPSLYVRVLTHGMFGPQPNGVRDHLVCSTRLLTSSADLVGSSRQLIPFVHVVCSQSLLSSSDPMVCSSRVPISSADVVCSCPLLTSIAHPVCSSPLVISSAHLVCSSNLLTSSVHLDCS